MARGCNILAGPGLLLAIGLGLPGTGSQTFVHWLRAPPCFVALCYKIERDCLASLMKDQTLGSSEPRDEDDPRSPLLSEETMFD